MNLLKTIFPALLLTLSAVLFAATGQSTVMPSPKTTPAKTMRATFTQVKTMRMLGEKMVSKGSMYYEADNKLRWEYTQPYAYTFVMNGHSVMLLKNGRKDIVDTQHNKVFREIGRIMTSSLTLSSMQQKKDLTLSKQMQSMYKRITVFFNPKSHLAERVVMTEKNGDTTEIQLHDVVVDKPVSASLFQIK